MAERHAVRVPKMGESVTSALVGRWAKKPGDAVAQDELLLELETDKVTLEINAPVAGTLEALAVQVGETTTPDSILAYIVPGEMAVSAVQTPGAESVLVASLPEVPTRPLPGSAASPAAQKLAREHALPATAIPATGRDGRITKQDVLQFLSAAQSIPAPHRGAQASGNARTRHVPLSPLRQTIARRLKEVQNTAAMLTTFNEIDMSAVMALRTQLQEEFTAKHGVRLGLMSFFVKACVSALKSFPEVNAQIQDNAFLYQDFYDIGVAVSTPKGLMVPIVRDADTLSFCQIEQEIADKATQARAGTMRAADMQNGTFTITNGGSFGSLMSTPILNGPQSGILGMHNIVRRPVAIGETIEIRPMMYVALSYDHRAVDGQQAVSFLMRIKSCIETPTRLLLDL